MTKPSAGKVQTLRERQTAPLVTPTDLKAKATKDIAAAMNAILADVFALYLKTKNFHWHMSGPHFRDYHLLLDEQADQIYAMSDQPGITKAYTIIGVVKNFNFESLHHAVGPLSFFLGNSISVVAGHSR